MSTTMRLVALIAAVLIAPSIIAARADEDVLFKTEPLNQTTIDQHRWSKRPILIFASSGEDAAFTRQLAILKSDTPGLVERELVVLSDIGPDRTNEVREALQVDGFEVILIGKDGGVKLRSKTPVDLDRLFARIDAMPMRQREMRNRPRTE